MGLQNAELRSLAVGKASSRMSQRGLVCTSPIWVWSNEACNVVPWESKCKRTEEQAHPHILIDGSKVNVLKSN